MNDMYIVSLRDILEDNLHYIYRGKLPEVAVPVYNTVVNSLGLDIDFEGTIIESCQEVEIAQASKIELSFEMFGYRRIQIREYIKSHFENYAIASRDILKPKYIICSEPRVAVIELIEKIAFGDEVTFIYDKTDNWGALESNLSKKLDEMCMKYADIITCSAIGLIDEKYKDKTHYVPNGNKMYNIENVEKYSTPTAIYAGNRIDKFNGDLLYRMACMYPEWNFKIYVNQEVSQVPCMQDHPPNVEFLLPIPQEELIKEMAKCHVGLLFFRNSKWCQGMLPLKLFNYINAKIPSFYTSGLEMNLQEYSEVAFSVSEYQLDELLELKDIDYSKYERDWAQVVQELITIWGIQNET